MQTSRTTRLVGAHRKLESSTKRRIALVAISASALAVGAATTPASATDAPEQEDLSLTSEEQQTTVIEETHTTVTEETVVTEDHTEPAVNQDPTDAPLLPEDGAEASAIEWNDPATAAPQVLEVPQLKPIEDLTEQLNSVLRFDAERKAADEAARAPIASPPASGTFTSPYAMRWGTMHWGIDIANSLGTPILAVQDATVIDAGPASGFGQWVRLLLEDGTVLVYGHMETIDVSVGEKVKAGQKIAGMGSRGYSTGSHLHFEVRPKGGEAIDPVAWLQNLGISI